MDNRTILPTIRVGDKVIEIRSKALAEVIQVERGTYTLRYETGWQKGMVFRKSRQQIYRAANHA